MLQWLLGSRTARLASRWGLWADCRERRKVGGDSLAGRRVLSLLVLGQSNAANFGESCHRPDPRVLNYFDGRLYEAADPLLGGADTGGSVWTRLGDMLLESRGLDTVVFAPVAPGGVNISQWSAKSELLRLALAAIDGLRRNGVPVDAVLWHQGEADRETDPAEYADHLKAVINSLRAAAADVPVFVAAATRSREDVSPAIREAQRSIANPDKGIYPGPDTDGLVGAYRHDGVHFSDSGLQEVARMWAEALRTIPEQ